MSNKGNIEENEAANISGLIFPVEKQVDRYREDLELLKPREEKIDRRETYAGLLAAGMFILFSIEIVAYIASAFLLENMENMNAVYQVVFPVTAGFLGSAVTYYHTSKVK